jgi:hypothetical protein
MSYKFLSGGWIGKSRDRQQFNVVVIKIREKTKEEKSGKCVKDVLN